MAIAGALPTLLLVMALTTMLIGVAWTVRVCVCVCVCVCARARAWLVGVGQGVGKFLIFYIKKNKFFTEKKSKSVKEL